MSGLAELADELRLPLETPGAAGLRPAQIAATHAIVAHFWSSREPALAVLPTGSGKTAVLLSVSILLRPRRVLVVTPGGLLRAQLARAFRTLADLKTVGAIAKRSGVPSVREVKGRLGTAEDWDALLLQHVVIGTPRSISPATDGVAPPPTDLFDLVLFDEAHHVPARTFSAIGDAFPAARQVLVTATPFRRDRRRIRAKVVFTYEVSEARRDGIFGKLHYKPVTAPAGTSEDVAIAKAAARQLLDDRARGFDHRLVVRAASKARADELARVYETETTLRLRRLHSSVREHELEEAVASLRAGTIDGVVAVDMLGEGFDLPQLKVAALHSPHRSLAVTLQFIGRFARVTAPNLGPATFFAVPRDVDEEADRLFVPGAEWNEIVEDLSRQRFAEEEELRQVLESFEPAADEESAQAGDDAAAILWGLRPYFHVKVYQAMGPVDMSAPLATPQGAVPVLVQYSERENAITWVGRESGPVRWLTSASWNDVSHVMFVIAHVPEQALLFICSSRRVSAVYDPLIASIAPEARPLAPNEMTRVLRGVTDQDHFSLGLRNKSSVGGGGAESYVIMTGPRAGLAIRTADLGRYDQGHVFCRGSENGEKVVVGYSSTSKVWSHRYDNLATLLRWIRALASKLGDAAPVPHQSLFDRLGRGERISSLPCRVIAADLPTVAYRRPTAKVLAGGESCWLIDFTVGVGRQDATSADVRLRSAGVELGFVWDVLATRVLRASDDLAASARIVDAAGRADVSLVDFLNESPPMLFLENLATITGTTMTLPPTGPTEPVRELIEAVDWAAEGVDPRLEKPVAVGSAGAGGMSIFEYVEVRARREGASVLFADDGSNEIADYVVVQDEGHRVRVDLVHCKATKELPVPGDRVKDLYEVIGQAVKCRRWLETRRLAKQVRHRAANSGGRFCLGDLARLQGLLQDPARVVFRVVVVQPGLSSEPKEVVADLIAAADAYQHGADRLPLRLWGTKPADEGIP